jgi:thioredoxin-dependent peroxiredoxin
VSVKLEVGDKAPDFVRTDENGHPVHLADRIGKKVVVLFFYPADNSAGCTREACAFRDSYEDFQDAGAEVIGVSGGTTEGKQKFIRNNRLPFTLINDADGAVQEMYGIGKGLLVVFPPRITFVIDREGIIRHKFESRINMDAHAKEALQIVQALAKEQVR